MVPSARLSKFFLSGLLVLVLADCAPLAAVENAAADGVVNKRFFHHLDADHDGAGAGAGAGVDVGIGIGAPDLVPVVAKAVVGDRGLSI